MVKTTTIHTTTDNAKEEEEEEEEEVCTFCTFPLLLSKEEETTTVIRLKKCAHSFHRECFKRWHIWRQKEWEKEMDELNWPRGSEEEKRARAKPTHECPLCRVVLEERFDFREERDDEEEKKKKEDVEDEEDEDALTMLSEEMLNKLRKQREMFRRKLLKARDIGALVAKDPSKTNANRPLVPRARDATTTRQTNGGEGTAEGRSSDSVAVGATTATSNRSRGRGSGFLARALARARIEDDDNS